MLTLINLNRMQPPIAPIGLDYVAGAAKRSDVDVEVLDLCLETDAGQALKRHFADRQPRLVGLSFRNIDDCFWPSGQSYLGQLAQDVASIRALTDAPIAIGGVGYSIFARQIIEQFDIDFGIRGDGEETIVRLFNEICGRQRWESVPGLVFQQGESVHENTPAWPSDLDVPTKRNAIDNDTYFRRGGQIGVETKRGCFRKCTYCADPLAKGNAARLRTPADVADEFEALMRQGVDVFHLCDAEFNLPIWHAAEVCDELIRRRLGDRMRWYAYLAVVPFTDELGQKMKRAGCVGINFTSDSAVPSMLETYGQPHRKTDLTEAVKICRRHEITVMLDMLLGGPGETPETVAETISAFQEIDPDCAGAALGIRIYPGTPIAQTLTANGRLEQNPGLKRHYSGPVDLLRSTFYISPALGPKPARLVRDLIGDDARFFPPEEETDGTIEQGKRDHNYNANQALIDAVDAGARGAYWDILRQMPGH
jgi:tryptophan 2-C-methyltransferase